MNVRGEPDYVDQVPRKLAFEKAHPDAVIDYRGPYWQAVVPEENGETVVTRISLAQLMDKLESLDGHPNPPGVP